MKTRWFWGAGLVVAVAVWAVRSPVTQARVDALVEELRPRVEAAVGSPLPDELQVLLLSHEEYLDHLTALRAEREGWDLMAAGAPEYHRDDVSMVRGNIGSFSADPPTVVICRPNVINIATEFDVEQLDALRLTLIHELVHAADAAAHPDFWRVVESDGRTDDEIPESDAVLRFLFEGHAELLTRRIAERAGVRETEARWSGWYADDWHMTVRYLRSADYLEWLASRGVGDAFAAALRDPPATLDEVLYPDVLGAASAPTAGEFVLDDALLALADSHGECSSPRLRDMPRHEFEGRFYRAGSSGARSLAFALTQHVEVRGELSDGRRSDEVAFARASVFDTEEAAEELLRKVGALAEASWELERVRHAEFSDSLEEQTLVEQPLHGNDWEGLAVSRRWTFSGLGGVRLEGHTPQAGKLEIRHAYARRGRVVLELFPVAGDGGPITPVPRFDSAFALIADSR